MDIALGAPVAPPSSGAPRVAAAMLISHLLHFGISRLPDLVVVAAQERLDLLTFARGLTIDGYATISAAHFTFKSSIEVLGRLLGPQLAVTPPTAILPYLLAVLAHELGLEHFLVLLVLIPPLLLQPINFLFNKLLFLFDKLLR